MQTSTQIKQLSQKELNLVRDNFEQIYPIFFQHTQQIDLVPSLWGDHVYHRTSWKGRLLSIMHPLVALFAGSKFRLSRLQKVVQKTHLTYQKLEKELIPFLKVYQDYLVNKCEVDDYPAENKIHMARNQIRAFYVSTFPYVRLFLTAESTDWKFRTLSQHWEQDRIEQNIKHFSKAFSLKFVTDLDSFYDRSCVKQCLGSMHIIALEGILQGPLPIKSLKTLSMYENSSDTFDGPLSKMMSTLRRKGTQLSIRTFHKAILSLVKLMQNRYKDMTELPVPEASRIVKGLTDKGFEGYLLADQKHIQWREALIEDRFQYVNAEGQLEERYLGKQLSAKSEGIDKHLVFEVMYKEGGIDSQHVLKIGLNRADLELRQLERKEEEYGIPTVEMTYLDPKGRFALMEKLVKPLNQYEWGTEWKKNQQMAQPIRDWIDHFVDQVYTPSNLSKHDLMFAQDGALKTIKGTKRENFNVMALENLAYEFANGHFTIYSYVIHSLAKEKRFAPYRQFFEIIISHALEGGAMSVAALGTLEVPPIVDAGIIRHAEKLYDDIARLKGKIMDRIKGKFRLVRPKHFQSALKAKILNAYHIYNTFGRLQPDLNEGFLLESLKSSNEIQPIDDTP